ncbi:MAG: hypothetical protein ACTSUE_15190 [Promethearchaeota archaeon]
MERLSVNYLVYQLEQPMVSQKAIHLESTMAFRQSMDWSIQVNMGPCFRETILVHNQDNIGGHYRDSIGESIVVTASGPRIAENRLSYKIRLVHSIG